MNRIVRTKLAAVAVFCGLACFAEAVLACPTCKDGMAGDPAYSNMVNGYFWSIIFMMSMPFLVFTGVAGYFYYLVRRARSQQAVTAQAVLSQDLPSASDSVAGSSEVGPGPEIALQS